MDETTPPPSWLRPLEQGTAVAATLCVLAVLFIILLHVFFRSACFSLHIC